MDVGPILKANGEPAEAVEPGPSALGRPPVFPLSSPSIGPATV